MTIARKSVLPVANVAIGALLGLLALKAIGLYMTKEAYGELEYAIALLGIFYLFADLSMSEAHVKRVSEGMHVGDCFATFAVFRVASSLLFLAATGGGLLFYTMVLGRTLEDTTTWTILFVMLYYVGKSAMSVAQSTFDARLEAARSQVVSLVETIVRVGLTILVALIFAAAARSAGPFVGRVEPSSAFARWIVADPGAALALTWTIGALLATGVSLFYLLKHVDRGKFRPEILKSYFAFAIPLFLPNAATFIAIFLDRVVLGLFGTSVDTADFAGPRRIVTVLEGVSIAVGLLLFPAVSGMIARGERGEALRTVDKALRYLSLFMVPIAAFLIVFPKPIILLGLGEAWLGAASTLAILAVAMLFVTFWRPLAHLLLGEGRSGLTARISLLAALVNIVLVLFFVPDDIKSIGLDLLGLKAFGAGLAFTISSAVGLGLFLVAARRVSGYRPRVAFHKHFAAAGIMVGVLWSLDAYTVLDPGRWFIMPLFIVGGGALYGGLLVAMREITDEDWRMLRDTLHPGEMGRYLRQELFGGKE